MKTITSITRLIGRKQHKGIFGLVDSVLNECIENDILTTNRNTPVTKEVVLNVVRSILSNIKKGQGIWKGWSYRISKDYIRLYDINSADMKELNLLESELYQDVPVLRVLVDPKIDGIEMDEYYKEFEHLNDAKDFVNNTMGAVDIFVFIDQLKIPLNYKTFD